MPVSVGDLSQVCQLEGDRLAAIAAEIFLAKSYLPLVLIANELFGSFGLPGAVPGTE